MYRNLTIYVSTLLALLFLNPAQAHFADAEPVKNAVTVIDLRCEYTVDPLNIDAAHPRLSWNIRTDIRGWEQSAYRIIAASSPARLGSGQGDLWDSRKVNSGNSVQVPYDGKILTAHQVVYWKVMVWDSKGRPGNWSKIARWGTGILNEADWKADWIGRTDRAYNEFDNSLAGSSWIWSDAGKQNTADTVGLRKDIEVPSVRDIREAYLLFTAKDEYIAYLNGQELSRSQPGTTYKQLKKINILDRITAGRNRLAFKAMAKERLKGLICRLLIRYRNGDSIIVRSDDTWQCTEGAVKDFFKPSDNATASAARIIAAADSKPFQRLLLHPPDVDPAPYLRKTFAVNGKVRRALIYVSAPGFAEVRINGQKAGGNTEREPGFTRFDKRLLYTAYDVTRAIRQGSNAIGTILGTGWYDVHDQAVWSLEKAPWRGRPRVKLQLYIEYQDGRTEVIGTDRTWKTSAGPILFDGIYTGEIYDANRELPGWDKAGYDDTGWAAAIKMKDPGGKLVAAICPPAGMDSLIRPIAITEPRKGIYIVDMGQNFSGHTELRIQAPKGTRITMRYAEVLNGQGMPETGNIEQFMAPSTPRQPFQTDTYICKGSGTEVWEQRFSYSGFRYVEVTGMPFPPKIDNFRGKFTHTLFEADGSILTSDTLVNRIQAIVQRGYLSNAQNIPTDCPQREKNGWTGDAHLAAETGIMNYNTTTFYTKWLDDQADAQLPSGLIPVIVPSADWGLHWEPEWNSAYHLICWYLYQYYGDRRILEKHYPRLKLYVDSLAVKRRDDGLLPGFGYGDWDPLDAITSKKLTANAYFFADADLLAKMAGVLRQREDSLHYRALAEDIRGRFNGAFYRPATGVYDNASQCAMSLPLQFGIVADDQRERVQQSLARSVEATPHIDAGILGTKNILRALSAMGRTDLAYRIVDRSEFPGWGYWITQDATSTWGGWGKPGVKNVGSLNHIMYGDVSAWLYNHIGGINPDPLSPGFKHFIIEPGVTGDLSWVKTRYRSVQGEITCDWAKTGRGLELSIRIPANTGATLKLPATSTELVTEDGHPAANSPGIRSVRAAGGSVFLEAGSGDYHLIIKN